MYNNILNETMYIEKIFKLNKVNEAGTKLADIQDKREIDAVRFPFLLI